MNLCEIVLWLSLQGIVNYLCSKFAKEIRLRKIINENGKFASGEW